MSLFRETFCQLNFDNGGCNKSRQCSPALQRLHPMIPSCPLLLVTYATF
uniref:Uncharacterized protein n=1 Tax=Anguilla anguilla TaxID=7936 RepID=A0A0E9SVX9_ANGAN